MIQNYRLFVFSIILILEMYGPFNVIFPSIVEARQVGIREKWLKQDFGLFMSHIDFIGMNLAQHDIPTLIPGSYFFIMLDGINNINESSAKSSSTFIKFLTLNHRHGIYASDEGAYQNSEQTETSTYKWGVCCGIRNTHGGPPEWILSVIGGLIGIFLGVLIVLSIFKHHS